MQKIQMKLFVLGARRGQFRNDEGEQIQYCAIFASDDVKQTDFLKGDAIGQVVQKIKAEFTVVDQIRHLADNQGGLPLYFDIEASLDFAIDGGSKVKALSVLGVSKNQDVKAPPPAKVPGQAPPQQPAPVRS